MEKSEGRTAPEDMPPVLTGMESLLAMDGKKREEFLLEDRTMYSQACRCVYPIQKKVPNLTPTRREALLYIAERLGTGISCRHIIKRPVKFSSNEEFTKRLAPIAGPKQPMPNQDLQAIAISTQRKDEAGRLRRFMTVSDISHDAVGMREDAMMKQYRDERGKIGSRRPVRTAQSAPDLDGRARPPRTSVPVHSSHQPHNSRAASHSRATGVSSLDKHIPASYTPYSDNRTWNELRESAYSRPTSTKTHPSVRFNIGVSRTSNNSTRYPSPGYSERSVRCGYQPEAIADGSSEGKLSPLASGSSENVDIDFEVETFIPADQVPHSIFQLENQVVANKKPSLLSHGKAVSSGVANTKTTFLLKPRSLSFTGDRKPTSAGKYPKIQDPPPRTRVVSPTLEKLKSARQMLGSLTTRSYLSDKDEDILCDDITGLPFPPSPTPTYKPRVSMKLRSISKPNTQLLNLVRNCNPNLFVSAGFYGSALASGKIGEEKEKVQALNRESTKVKGTKMAEPRTGEVTMLKQSGLKPLKLVMPVRSSGTAPSIKPRLAILKSKEPPKDVKPCENDVSLIVQSFPLPRAVHPEKEVSSGRKSRTLDVNIPINSMPESSHGTLPSSDTVSEQSSRVQPNSNCERSEQGGHTNSESPKLSIALSQGNEIKEKHQSLLGPEHGYNFCGSNCPFNHDSAAAVGNEYLKDEPKLEDIATNNGTHSLTADDSEEGKQQKSRSEEDLNDIDNAASRGNIHEKDVKTACHEPEKITDINEEVQQITTDTGDPSQNQNKQSLLSHQLLVTSGGRELARETAESLIPKEETKDGQNAGPSLSIPVPVIDQDVIIKREKSKIKLNELEFDRSKNQGIMRIAASAGLDTEDTNDLYYTRDSKILSKVFIDRLVDIAFGSDEESEEGEP